MFSELEPIGGAREVEVAAGIEVIGEGRRAVFQVGFDFEFTHHARIAGKGRRSAPPTEALPPFFRRSVGEHAEFAGIEHSRQRQILAPVAAVGEGRIGQHRLPLQRTQGDGEGSGSRRGGDQDRASGHPGMQGEEREGAHSAHRGSDQGGQPLDAEDRKTWKPASATSSRLRGGKPSR